MVITNEINLPTEAELTVPEVSLSGPALRAGSFHMGKYCEAQNNVGAHHGHGFIRCPSVDLWHLLHYII